MADDADQEEPWLKQWWRPAMGIQYIIVCVFDFIIFPGIYTGIYAGGGAFHEWKPLTLSNGGLYHAAMGAIVGVVAWQRTKEKLAAMGSGTTIERVTERSSVSTTPLAEQPPDSSSRSMRAD